MCGCITKDLEDLETHLLTCEIYRCKLCQNVFKNMTDLKEHFLQDHASETYRPTEHIKTNRKDKEQFDIKSYYFEYLLGK